jgi:hypothetical protein
MSNSPNRRHLWIPDTQLKPGVDTRHIDWAAQAILDYRPEVIVVAGDWWDMPSLNGHVTPGSIEREGARYVADVEVGNEAFRRLVAPMIAERARLSNNKKRQWNPVCKFLFGNHEDRITRAVKADPRLEGVLSLEHLETPGFDRHSFLEIVEIDGIAYSHYFSNTHSNRPIGGSIDNRLNKIGKSFVQGHEQGLLYGIKQFPGNLTRHGLVAGSYYLHDEQYRGAQSNGEWRGIVVLNGVSEGAYDVMPVSMKYLEQRYG